MSEAPAPDTLEVILHQPIENGDSYLVFEPTPGTQWVYDDVENAVTLAFPPEPGSRVILRYEPL